MTEGVSGNVCRFPDAGIVDKLPWEAVRCPTKYRQKSRHIAHVQKIDDAYDVVSYFHLPGQRDQENLDLEDG